MCNYQDCKRPHHAKGLCNTHYGRLLRNGDPSIANGPSSYPEICQAIYLDKSQCNRPHYSKNYCKKHYQQWWRYGDPLIEKKKQLQAKFYKKVFMPQHPNASQTGYILEHRLVMSQHLGRPLFEDENVHHKNGNRHDNRLENLELWSSAQPAGQRVEDKLAYAIQMLRRYSQDLPIEPSDKL